MGRQFMPDRNPLLLKGVVTGRSYLLVPYDEHAYLLKVSLDTASRQKFEARKLKGGIQRDGSIWFRRHNHLGRIDVKAGHDGAGWSGEISPGAQVEILVSFSETGSHELEQVLVVGTAHTA